MDEQVGKKGAQVSSLLLFSKAELIIHCFIVLMKTNLDKIKRDSSVVPNSRNFIGMTNKWMSKSVKKVPKLYLGTFFTGNRHLLALFRKSFCSSKELKRRGILLLVKIHAIDVFINRVGQ